MKVTVYYAKSIEKQEKKWEHRAGEALLALGLKQIYGLELSRELRGKGNHGKPYLLAHPGIHYNISHSGQYVMCAFAPWPIGADIQEHKQVKIERMLKRMVSPKTEEEILASDNPRQGFFDQWALRESYLKWTGEGFTKDPRTIPMDQGWHTLLAIDPCCSCALWGEEKMKITVEEINLRTDSFGS